MLVEAKDVWPHSDAKKILWDLTESTRRELASEIECQQGLARIRADVAFKHLGCKSLEYEVCGEDGGEVTKMRFEVVAVQESPSSPCGTYDLVDEVLDALTLTTEVEVEVPADIIYVPEGISGGASLMTRDEFAQRLRKIEQFACHVCPGSYSDLLTKQMTVWQKALKHWVEGPPDKVRDAIYEGKKLTRQLAHQLGVQLETG